MKKKTNEPPSAVTAATETNTQPPRPPSPSRDTPLPPTQPSSVSLPNVRMARPKEWNKQKFVIETCYFFLATQGEPGSPRYQRITSLQVEVMDNGQPRRFELRVDGKPADFHEIVHGDDTEKGKA